jgi:phage-related protein
MTQPAVGSITAEARSAVTELISSIQQSVTSAVADAANKISQDFTEHVNKELTEMTAKFKETHPAITGAVTDVVGYADAINTTATAVQNTVGQVQDAATKLKELPAAIKDIRTGLQDTAKEVGQLGRDLRSMAASAPGAVRDLATSVSGNLNKAFAAARKGAADAGAAIGKFAGSAKSMAGSVASAVSSLVQLAAGYAKAAAQAVIAAAKTVVMTVVQKTVAVATRLWAIAQTLLNAVMRMNPIGLLITALTLLVAGFVLAYQRSTTFRTIVNTVFTAIRNIIVTAINVIRNIIAVVWPYISKVIEVAVKLISTYVTTYFTIVRTVITTVWNVVKAIITGAVNAIVATIKGVSRVVGIVSDAFNQAKSAVGSAISGLVSFVTGLPGRVIGALGNIGRLLYDKGKDLISGFINGIRDMAGSIVSSIKDFILDKIPGPIKSFLGISSPSRLMADIGRNVGDGLVVGIDASGDDVSKAMTRLVPVPKSTTIRPAMANLAASVATSAAGPLATAARETSASPVTVNVHPRAGQSEYEIGRIAAREVAWAAKH